MLPMIRKPPLIVLLAVFSAVLLVAGVVRSPNLRWRSPWYLSGADYRQPSSGVEFALVYVGAPTCIWSNAAELPSVVARARGYVQTQAAARGHSFAAIGVSQSNSVTRGIEHLRKFGPFDEVSTGRGWHNIALLKFVYTEHVGPASTPQLILVERTVAPEMRPAIHDERVLLRLVGLGSIRHWVDKGAPIPRAEHITRS